MFTYIREYHWGYFANFDVFKQCIDATIIFGVKLLLQDERVDPSDRNNYAI